MDGDVNDAIHELTGQRRDADEQQFSDNVCHPRRRVHDEDSRNVPPGVNVIFEVSRHRHTVVRDQNEIMSIAPEQNFGVCCGQ